MLNFVRNFYSLIKASVNAFRFLKIPNCLLRKTEHVYFPIYFLSSPACRSGDAGICARYLYQYIMSIPFSILF
eukprot:UN03001